MHSSVTIKKTGVLREETRLFVTSLDPQERTPRQLLQLVRGHWAVENGNHYRRDATWAEDSNRLRPRRALNLALLRTALLGPLLREGSINLRAHCQRCAAKPSLALRFVTSVAPGP